MKNEPFTWVAPLKLSLLVFIGMLSACKTVNVATIPQLKLINKHIIKGYWIDFTFWKSPKWLKDDVICFVGGKHEDIYTYMRHYIYVYDMKTSTLKELVSLPWDETILSYWVSPEIDQVIYSTIEIPSGSFAPLPRSPRFFFSRQSFDEAIHTLRVKINTPITYCKLMDRDSLYVFWWHSNELPIEVYRLNDGRLIVGTATLESNYTRKDSQLSVLELTAIPGRIYLVEECDSSTIIMTGSLLRPMYDSLIHYITITNDTQLFAINPFTREKELIQPHLHAPPYSQYKYDYGWWVVADTELFFDIMPAEEMMLYVPCIIPVNHIDSLILSYFDPLRGMVFYNPRNGQKAHLTINYKPIIYAISPDRRRIAFFQNTLKPNGYAIEIYVYDWSYKIDRILDKIR